MKKKGILILATILVLISCQNKEKTSLETVLNSGSLKQLTAKKKEISSSLDQFNKDLESINKAIAAIDTVKKLPLVTALTAKSEVFTHFLELQGNVQTKQNILVYPEMPGVLLDILVKEGQKVIKGQLLAQIDDGGLSNQVSQLEITTQLAKTTFERQQRLWNQKIGSEIQYLQSKSNYEAQKSALKQLKKQQAKSLIRAPFNGVIDQIFKEPGTVIAPGQGSEVFRIVNLNNMYVEAEVPERYIATITKNKKVKVTFPVLGKSVTSTVKQVGSFINPNNRSFKIEVSVPNKEGTIKPNLTAKLQINDYTNPNAILIPQSIISENANGQQFVYELKNKNNKNEAVAKRLIISTGKTQGNFIEVLENLSEGTEIIEEGARSVNNGQTVKVITQ